MKSCISSEEKWRELAELCNIVADCRAKGLTLYGADAGAVACALDACREDLGKRKLKDSNPPEGFIWAKKKGSDNWEIVQIIYLEDHGMIPWVFPTNEKDYPAHELECYECGSLHHE